MSDRGLIVHIDIHFDTCKVFLFVHNLLALTYDQYLEKMTLVKNKYQNLHNADGHFLWEDLCTGIKYSSSWSWQSFKLAIIGGIYISQIGWVLLYYIILFMDKKRNIVKSFISFLPPLSLSLSLSLVKYDSNIYLRLQTFCSFLLKMFCLFVCMGFIVPLMNASLIW